ncbi:MAG: fused MFS/spermidine synthase, partial [Candidatus Obscuribacterales bacterium]|nr:fused MFS/spermidine synthase [Candidatus Obscuribacterales bacterium]
MSDSNAAENLTTTKSKGSSNKLRSVTLLFLLSGLSSLIYQVIWTRQMVFVFGSSTFASATVISAFMGGLAIGSFIAGKYADKIRNPFLCYGILEGVIGVWAIMAPFMFEAALPLYKMFWQQFHFSVLPFSVLRFCVVSLILLPPTACMGATLPLLSKFVTSSLSVVGNRVGTLYSINTLGAVSGALISGFYLIPAHGLFVSTMIAAATNILLAVLVFLLNKELNAEPATIPEESAELNIPDDSDRAIENIKQETTISKQALFTIIAFGNSGAIAKINEVAWTRALLLVIGSTTYAFSIMLSTFLIGIFIGSFVCAKYVDQFKNAYFSFSVLQVLLGLAGLASICLFNY